MQEIICTSQAELDAVPTDFDGRVAIKFGTPYNRAVINRRFKCSVEARDSSSVVAWGNSSVVAWDNSSVVAWRDSSVEAWGNSSVVAWDNSSVVARGNSSVEARDSSSVVAWDNSSVEAWDNSSVEAWGNSSVVAWGNSSVVAWDNSSVVAWRDSSVVAWDNSSVVARGNSSVEARDSSSVVAWDNSSVEAWGNSSVVARGNSSVEARDNSSVVAWGNSQVCRKSKNAKIVINGNAREVHSPQTVAEYAEFYDLPIDAETQTIKLYKAVHRQSGEDYFISDWDNSFRYVVGGTVTPNSFNANAEWECGAGINLAHKAWAVAYGQDWRDLAIIECECKCDEVLVPEFTDDKVRAKRAKVLREVPLEECGLLGKIIAKKDGQK